MKSVNKSINKSIIVGTAGHIDHGKSALVLKLTGTDPDRWAEEKRRGITIDLGFAHLDSGEFRFGFVDVPGHERFVRNMLAGAGGIDVVVLVIAADESIKPQTREHFDICRLLGIKRGLVALTKSDLVEPDMLGLVRLEVEEFLQGSFLDGAPIVPFSAKTGSGADEVRQALEAIAAEIPGKDSARHFRLPIDRSFVMKGFGTVATGTLISGRIKSGGEVEVFPDRSRFRVRGLQVHGEKTSEAVAGQRTAVNLAGGDTETLARGMVLAAPGRFEPATRFDVQVQVLPSARALKDGARVHLHQGTADVVATVRLLEGRQAGPGTECFAQLRLSAPVLALPGDRFILRRYSPVVTIGGGRILGVSKGRYRRGDAAVRAYFETLAAGSREDILLALLGRESHGTLTAQDLVARCGWLDSEIEQAVAALEATGAVRRISARPLTVTSEAVFGELGPKVIATLDAFHRAQPLVEGLPKEELREKLFSSAPDPLFDAVFADLMATGEIDLTGDRVRRSGREVTLSQEESDARQAIEQAFANAGLQVPAVDKVLAGVKVDVARARQIVQILLKEGVLVRVANGLLFHRTAIESLEDMLRGYQAERGDRIDVSAFKALAGVTRKYAIPLLEYLDRQRKTRRDGNERMILL